MNIQNEYPDWLNNFIDIYQRLSTDNLDLLQQLYDEDIEFYDASTQIKGFGNLSSYFSNLYTNVSACRFDISEVFYQQQSAAIYWTMTMCHHKLNKGQPIVVEGHSLVRGDSDKVYYHKDFVDLGAMVYEHLPVIGRLVKVIKKRMS